MHNVLILSVNVNTWIKQNLKAEQENLRIVHTFHREIILFSRALCQELSNKHNRAKQVIYFIWT